MSDTEELVRYIEHLTAKDVEKIIRNLPRLTEALAAPARPARPSRTAQTE